MTQVWDVRRLGFQSLDSTSSVCYWVVDTLWIYRYEEAADAVNREINYLSKTDHAGQLNKLVMALVLIHLNRGDYVAADQAFQRALRWTILFFLNFTILDYRLNGAIDGELSDPDYDRLNYAWIIDAVNLFIYLFDYFIEHAKAILNNFKVQNVLPTGSSRFGKTSSVPYWNILEIIFAWQTKHLNKKLLQKYRKNSKT